MLVNLFSFVKRTLIYYHLAMTQILVASPIKKKITKELKAECKLLKERNVIPFLKVILVGHDPASVVYTTNKKKFCEKVGAKCEIVELPNTISENEFLNILNDINTDKNVHGCIIQLPLPSQLTHLDIGTLINKNKDVDGFHPENLYSVMRGQYTPLDFVSCTPKGIITLLKEYEVPLAGKNVVIIGRSMIVGKPLSLLLTNENATVTLAHSRTENLKDLTKKADIIVCALGKANFLDRSYLNSSSNQVVIDVGINKDGEGNMFGDANYSDIFDHVKAITPVPGGIGPMTIVSLVQNLLQAAKKEISI
jgi:methylenetetrahydrofolate dehydrogenase (NADP+)/methenyltetrahydrofolate cyclohydrolase